MSKKIWTAVAVAAALSVAACGQGPAEEAGEATDTAIEESTTGSTDLGQGPNEEMGEAADAANENALPADPNAPPADPAAPTTP